MPLGAIIGGGLSLLGGLFGNKPKKTTQTTTTSVDAVKMVAEAERAGFNPVTFLNAGGLSGFMTTTGTGTESGGGPTFGKALVGAAQTTFDLWRQDQMMMDARAHETKLLDMQLGAGMKMSQIRAGGGTSRSMTGGAKQATVAGSLGMVPTDNPMGLPTLPEVGETTVTNPFRGWNVDPTKRDVAAAEERWGDAELLQTIFGVSRLWDDVWYNVTGKTSVQRQEATKSIAKSFVDRFMTDDGMEQWRVDSAHTPHGQRPGYW